MSTVVHEIIDGWMNEVVYEEDGTIARVPLYAVPVDRFAVFAFELETRLANPAVVDSGDIIAEIQAAIEAARSV